MRLLILSDLHLEIWRERAPAINPALSRPDAVILAGDIGHPQEALAWARATFAGLPVIYVSGNHEAYGDSWEHAQHSLRQQASQHASLHVLARKELIMDEVRFLGATLWTDYALFGEDKRDDAIVAASKVMLDYRRIRMDAQDAQNAAAPHITATSTAIETETRMMTPHDTIALHRADLAWLREKLATPFAGRTVVVSHMAPSMQSVAARYADDLVSAAFASDLETLAAQADLWVHGHTHDSFDYRIGRCRVVCNPCGYIRRDGTPENPHYDPQLIVEV